jgi:hypothetical protein
MLTLRQGDAGASPVIADIGFRDLQFRNTVHRADGAEFLLRGYKAERLLFENVDFVSSPIASDGSRSALRCNFIKTDTFETRWYNCNFWGILGCAVDISDGPQSDTVLFRGCVWSYCAVACAFGFGRGSGINGLLVESCKVIGNQGGFYVSRGNDSFVSTRAVAGKGRFIEVEDGRNFRPNKAIVVGSGRGATKYAIVRGVSGNLITLDRDITCNRGDAVIHGVFGFLFGHTSMPRIQSSQLEGCDVGAYLLDGRALTVDSTSFVSCARGVLINAQFQYLKLSMCTGATMGRMRNAEPWELVSIIGVDNGSNLIAFEGLRFEDSGYYKGNPTSAVANHSDQEIAVSWASRDTCGGGEGAAGLSSGTATCLEVAPGR